jgi:uncharacterized lipoprotein YddW (UPF0748 family)
MACQLWAGVGRRLSAVLTGCSLLFAVTGAAQSNEFRGLWVDAWGGNYTTPEKCSRVIADARSANLNSLIIQARRRGDAFYNSHFEPKNTEVQPQSFDPLADLIAKAHDTSNGKQKIEIHAWLVTYHIWPGNRPPTQPDHPFNVHRDWLMKDYHGNILVEGQNTFDPAHPDVQRHTFNVCMDIVTNYNVDGLHFDYIRYANTEQGYHDVAVARFNRLFNRSGKPKPEDEVWKQFRRDQVTALVRKVYLCAIAARPEVKLSASTIAWSPGVTSDIEWTNRGRAYGSVLQDWRGWMEEGILDLNCPMTYYRHHRPESVVDYYKWCSFAADHKFNRQLVIGPGIYLNSVSNGLHQMRYTRKATANGNKADGVCGYAYRETNNERVSTADFLAALTKPSRFDAESPPMFAERAEIPPMPWKTAPTTGHLKGFVYGDSAANVMDGATITLDGPVKRKMISDATGFYGSVDLPPGSYSITADYAGFRFLESGVTISVGDVTTRDLLLSKLIAEGDSK